MAYLKLTLGFSECKANESLRLQIISESLIHVCISIQIFLCPIGKVK